MYKTDAADDESGKKSGNPSTSWRRNVRQVLLAAGIFACVTTAHGHAGGNEDVMATIDAVPAALAGIKVELHKTLGQQLVVENATDSPLEVLGIDGEPFLRIGPEGVHANVNARDWYRFYSIGGVPLPPRLASLQKDARLAPDWQIVSRQRAWGWFDTRLDTEPLKVPHRVRDSQVRTAFKAWRIPVRLQGNRQLLTGQFQFMPQPRGFYEARITSPAEIAPGVFLQVMQGPVPGFMLSNAGQQTVTILGRDGKPFIEMNATGVRANIHSSTWRSSGLAESSFVAPDAGVSAGNEVAWQVRSVTPRYTWLDVRAVAAADDVAAGKPAARTAAQQWEIPFSVDGQAGTVRGITKWVDYRKG